MGDSQLSKQSRSLEDMQENLVVYESARNELIQRLGLRDQALIAYIASAGAYFGFVVAPSQEQDFAMGLASEAALILVLPILSLVFTYVILQHHVMIGKIGQFTRIMMPPDTMHWDKFYASWPDKSYLSARTIRQALLLVLPIAYAAAAGLKMLPKASTNIASGSIVFLVLAVDVAVFAVTMRLQFWAYRLRMETDYTEQT